MASNQHSSADVVLVALDYLYHGTGATGRSETWQEGRLALQDLVEQLEVMQRERDTWKGAAEYQPSSWSDLWGKERERADELQEQFDALHAAASELADFLWHEKETREPPSELLDAGYVAMETSADYEREEALGEKLLIALGRDPNEASSPAISPEVNDVE